MLPVTPLKLSWFQVIPLQELPSKCILAPELRVGNSNLQNANLEVKKGHMYLKFTSSEFEFSKSNSGPKRELLTGNARSHQSALYKKYSKNRTLISNNLIQNSRSIGAFWRRKKTAREIWIFAFCKFEFSFKITQKFRRRRPRFCVL